MLKIIVGSILLCLGCTGVSYADFAPHFSRVDTLIRISGKVVNADDSTSIPARIIYQKLPYFDDMGIATSKNEDGAYEMYMLKNNKYAIQITASGYDDFSEEFVVEVADGAEQLEKHFYISPDADNKKISLDDLRFAPRSAKISQGSFAELNEVVQWMKDRPKKIIQLEGHTDFAGNAAANMKLSQQRVDSIKEYLNKNGIRKSRIRTKAFGGTQPLTTERTDEAKARNRRVEVRIIN